MNTGPTFIACRQSAEAMQPREGVLDDPPRAPQAAPVWLAALGKLGGDSTPVEDITMRLRVVGAVALNRVRLASWTARLAAQRWDRIDQ